MNIKEIFRRPAQTKKVFEGQALTEEGHTYLDQVLTEYRLQLPSPAPTADELAVRRIADAIVAKQDNERTWGDLFALEIAVVKLQTEEALRRGAWAIRIKYKDLVGEKTYEAYQSSSPPDPKTGDVNQLRCDTLQILAEFHWAYAFAPLRENIRSVLLKRIFFITTAVALLTLAIAAIIYYRADGDMSMQIPLLAVVIAFGMLGGYISLQQRIQSVPSTGDPIVNISDLSNSQFTLYLAPISGAVFAVILYIIFIGGLLAGPLFPTIYTPPKCPQAGAQNPGPKQENLPNQSAGIGSNTGNASQAPSEIPIQKSSVAGGAPADSHTAAQENSSASPATASIAGGKTGEHKKSGVAQPASKACTESVEFSNFLKQTGPDSGASFAILLVWSFIAGFAERFVPDTIDRLVSQAEKK